MYIIALFVWNLKHFEIWVSFVFFKVGFKFFSIEPLKKKRKFEFKIENKKVNEVKLRN